MPTITEPYGSVEYYADLLRDGGLAALDSLTIHFVDDVATAAFHKGADRLGRIRNVLAAAKLVREEKLAAAR